MFSEIFKSSKKYLVKIIRQKLNFSTRGGITKREKNQRGNKYLTT